MFSRILLKNYSRIFQVNQFLTQNILYSIASYLFGKQNLAWQQNLTGFVKSDPWKTLMIDIGYLFTISDKDSIWLDYQSATLVMDSFQVGYLFTISDKDSFWVDCQSATWMMDSFQIGYLFAISDKDSFWVGYESATWVMDSFQIGYLFTIPDKDSFWIG